MSWALDIADTLASSPAPDTGARALFVGRIASGVMDFVARVPLHERALLEAIATECGTSVALPPLRDAVEQAEVGVWEGLTGQARWALFATRWRR